MGAGPLLLVKTRKQVSMFMAIVIFFHDIFSCEWLNLKIEIHRFRGLNIYMLNRCTSLYAHVIMYL